MGEKIGVDPLKAIVVYEMERAFALLVGPIAERIVKKLRRDYQYKTRPSDPLRRVRKELEGVKSVRKLQPRIVNSTTTAIVRDGAKLRAVREESKLSQQALAEVIDGISQTDISAMERGKKPIPNKVWDFVGLNETACRA